MRIPCPVTFQIPFSSPRAVAKLYLPSVGWPVPSIKNAVLVPQRDVSVRKFSGRGVIGRITDAAAGCHSEHLFDPGLGHVPQLHFVREVLELPRLGAVWRPAGLAVAWLIRWL